jgi:hypothetical protein
MRLSIVLLMFAAFLISSAGGTAPDGTSPRPAEPKVKPYIRQVREIEGWKVRVDIRLLEGPDAELGAKALRVLAYKLYEIKSLLPKDRIAKLQKAAIVLDLDYPLGSMQYHPSAQWLKEHGHDPRLAKAVHIPKARQLAGLLPINQQPMVILHELAHAYHDQVLGFDEPRIQKAWARFKDSGKYDKVLHISGGQRRHYALTDHKEFFAELTEAFFGTNDFYPFVRGELKKELPDVDRLLDEIWRGETNKKR